MYFTPYYKFLCKFSSAQNLILIIIGLILLLSSKPYIMNEIKKYYVAFCIIIYVHSNIQNIIHQNVEICYMLILTSVKSL